MTREGIDMSNWSVGEIRNYLVAICIASSISAQPAFSAELTGIFVYVHDGVHLSKCDGSKSLRLQLAGAYPQVAASVVPRKNARLNAISITVLIDSQSASPQTAMQTDSLLVTQVIRVGSAMECNITGKDRPLIGTSWSTPLEPGSHQSEANTGEPPRQVSFRLSPDGQIAGNDGCNSFFGKYALSKSGKINAVLQRTLMACSPPPHPAGSFLTEPQELRVSGRTLVVSPGAHVFLADDNTRAR